MYVWEERKGGQRSIWLVDTRKDTIPSPYRNETNDGGGYSHKGKLRLLSLT